MSLNLRNLLPFSKRSASFLVCETDGFTLRGAVIGRQADQLAVSYTAHSEAAEYKTAVAEVVAEVRRQGWGGDKAILLTPGALATLVDLPVAPDAPRPPEQMMELVRWELEPLLMQHTTLWSVGRILVGLGYLTEAQAAEVLERQQGRKNVDAGASALEVYSFKRFGELAIEMGYIDHRQMEECLTRQAWLQASGEEIACGWAAQLVPESHAAENSYPWLVSGVNQGMMQQWAAAFAESGMTLESIYPLVGCASTVPDVVAEEAGDVLLIEAHAGLVAGVRVSAKAITAINLQQSTLHGVLEACLEAYHALTPPEAKTVILASARGESEGLATGLAAISGRAVQPLPLESAEATPGMLGAVRHALGLRGAERGCAVSVQGPKVPLWHRVEVRAIAAGMLLLLAVGGAEAVLQVRQGLAEAERDRVGKAAAELDAAIAKVQGRIDHIKKLQDELKAKNDEIDALQKRMDLLATEVPKRAALVQALLNELSSTVPDDMVIDRIEETPQAGFRITAWALTEKSTQQFVKSFQTAMAPFGLKLKDVTVDTQPGRLSLLGYTLKFRVTDQLDALPAVAATPAGKK